MTRKLKKATPVASLLHLRTVTPAGQQLEAELREEMLSALAEKYIIALSEAVRHNCLGEVSVLVSILAAEEEMGPLFSPTVTGSDVDYSALWLLFNSGECSNLLPKLTAWKWLQVLAVEARQQRCRQLNISQAVYKRAADTHLQLSGVIHRAKIRVNDHPAGLTEITASFLPSFGKALLRLTDPQLHQYQSLLGATLTADVELAVSWPADKSHNVLMLVTNLQAAIATTPGKIVEASMVTLEMLRLAFGRHVACKQKITLERRAVVPACDEYWYLDGSLAAGPFRFPAPQSPQTTRAIAREIAYQLDFKTFDTLLSCHILQRIDWLRRWADPTLPEIPRKRLYHWFLQRLGTIHTREQLAANRARLTLSWEDVEMLCESPGLRQRVEHLSAGYPKEVSIAGQKLTVEYDDATKTVQLNVRLNMEVLDKACDVELPWGWVGLPIRFSIQGKYPFIWQTYCAGQEFFREVRRKRFAIENSLSCASSIDPLRQRNGLMLRCLEIQHPDGPEQVWLVAGIDHQAYTDYQTALQEARKQLLDLVKTEIRGCMQVMRVRSCAKMMVDMMAQQVAELANSRFDNMPVLRQHIIDMLSVAMKSPHDRVREEFKILLAGLVNSSNQVLRGRCMCLQSEAEDAISVGDIVTAERKLAEARERVVAAQMAVAVPKSSS